MLKLSFIFVLWKIGCYLFGDFFSGEGGYFIELFVKTLNIKIESFRHNPQQKNTCIFYLLNIDHDIFNYGTIISCKQIIRKTKALFWTLYIFLFYKIIGNLDLLSMQSWRDMYHTKNFGTINCFCSEREGVFSTIDHSNTTCYIFWGIEEFCLLLYCTCI